MSDLETRHLPLSVADVNDGWVVCPLGQVASDIQTGFASGQHNRNGEGVPHLRPMNVSPDGAIDLSDGRFVSADRGDQRLVRGDVLFNNTNSPAWVGKTALVKTDDELAFSNHMTRLRFGAGVLSAFVAQQLHFLCRSGYFKHQCKKHVNQASISRTFLSTSTPFFLPPLNEQRRIVTKIEALQERSDAAKEALDAIPPLLERFRQSVLAAAFRGDLTKDWRAKNKGVEPASVLLERIRKERKARFIEDAAEKARARVEAKATQAGKPWTDADNATVLAKERGKAAGKYKAPEPVDTTDLPELPEGWCWTSVDDLSFVVRGASPRPAGDPRYFGNGDTPWITVGEITKDEQIYLESVSTFITDAGRAASRYIPPNNLLLTNSGATLGVPKVTKIGGCINDGSVALLYLSDRTQVYVYYYLRSLTKWLRGLNQGAAQPNLNTTIVRSIRVPLPPAAEQASLVGSLQQLLPSVIEQQDEVETKLALLASLNQSILAKAFRGELVPQDPSDEPASVLLERIRAERAQAEAEKKAAKKSSKKRRARKKA